MLVAIGMGILTVIFIAVASLGIGLIIFGIEDVEPIQIISGIVLIVILFASLYYLIGLTAS